MVARNCYDEKTFAQYFGLVFLPMLQKFKGTEREWSLPDWSEVSDELICSKHYGPQVEFFEYEEWRKEWKKSIESAKEKRYEELRTAPHNSHENNYIPNEQAKELIKEIITNSKKELESIAAWRSKYGWGDETKQYGEKSYERFMQRTSH